MDTGNISRRATATTCSLFVFLLFAFPNYCDRCTYRDVEELLKSSVSTSTSCAEVPPACCNNAAGAGTTPGGDRDAPPGGKKADHNRVPYCIGSTLTTVTTHSDVLGEIRRTVSPETFRALETAFARLSPVLDHKESRAPPT